MKQSLHALLVQIENCNGSDKALDQALELTLRGRKGDAPAYSSSVDRCIELIHEMLPDWHWHVGRGASGVMPYASISKGRESLSADGVTVPLVLLEVLLKALIIKKRSE